MFTREDIAILLKLGCVETVLFILDNNYEDEPVVIDEEIICFYLDGLAERSRFNYSAIGFFIDYILPNHKDNWVEVLWNHFVSKPSLNGEYVSTKLYVFLKSQEIHVNREDEVNKWLDVNGINSVIDLDFTFNNLDN